MTTILTVLLALTGLTLLHLRPATPAARTWTELAAARRAAGWPRVAARAVQITLVLALLVLATACRLLWHTVHAIGTVLALVAVGISALGSGPELAGGQA